MASGRQLWEGAEFAALCGAKSAGTLRFAALVQMLAEAENAALVGRTIDAVGHLRELQAHCEKLINVMMPPHGKGGPRAWQRKL